MIEGTVVKSTGSWYIVQTEDGEQIQCRIKGKFRLDEFQVTNPVAVGDQVKLEVEDVEEKTGIIKNILPRKNYVVRQSPRKKHYVHLIASNIDQAIVIVTLREPKLKLGFVDRFLLMTEPYNIPVIIVINKIDLLDEEDWEVAEGIRAIYEAIGYTVLFVSSETGEGVPEIKEHLIDKTTLISGQSGVGKSTLVNQVEPNLDLRTGEISDYSGKGQHTTTFAEMFDLSFGGSIIDTPGIKTLSFNHLEVMDIAHNFREFFILSENCRFNDCTHRNEPHCAVKQALEEGRITNLRYESYLNLVEEVEDQNYWERKDV